MEQDMHYYGVGFLARAAGIPRDKAHIIAYASQYVDDSTESVAIHIGDGTFDTVRTAHLGPEAWTSRVHKSIYVPFHFLPGKPIRKLGDSYVTKPNSDFSRMVLQRTQDERDERDRLIAVGIAMHTYADTFAHQGFTGRDDDENQIRGLAGFEDGAWKPNDFQNLLGSVLRGVGHLLAGGYPDYPWLSWKYKRIDGSKVERNNLDIYVSAMKAIYDRFAEMQDANEPRIPWTKAFAKRLKDTISIVDSDLAWRIYAWIDLYGDTFRDKNGYRSIQGYRYEKLKWRSEAVDPVGNLTVAWDDLKPEDLARQVYKPKPGFLTSNWARFHAMALKQRHFVQQRLL